MGIRDPTTAKIGEEIFPFEIETVPEYFLKKAEEELHDTPERRAQGLREIKELVKNDEHTKNIEFDDDFLLQYLRVRKYNVARAFNQLKALVALKKKYPLMFTNFSYDKIVKSTDDKVISVLPWRCQDGCTILLIELDNWIPETFPVEEGKRAYVLYLLESLRNPMTQINGFKFIYDLRSNPLRHLKHLTPENLYLLYHGTQRMISKARKVFRKGYHPGWTEEAFAIYKRYPTNPPTCVLQDLSGKEIAGRFYAGELQKVDKTDKYFWAIEKIVLRIRKESYDTAFEYDDTNFSAAGKNAGLKERWKRVKEGKVLDICGMLHIYLGAPPRLLISGTTIRIRLLKAKDGFAILANAGSYRLRIENISLFAKKCDVSSSILVGHEKTLEHSLVQMPFTRIKTKTFWIEECYHSKCDEWNSPLTNDSRISV
ncbi:hypothetical protein CDAR_184581 [Caerostris darwini]|uniref:CRAL/TRIO N-terminal domain-containing protein n=1 Tax=Caerostris darwini TaxID=1538125 RepID=A0AAV4RGM3_9ARAC|nr:hypothetical protein CDAR_184581 [Caerostris darwini]